MHDLVRPHFDSAALLTIDVQADTLDGGPLQIPGTSAAVPRIADLCQAFRSSGRPIVHIVRIYLADGSNAEPVRRQLVTGPIAVLRAGTPGRLLAPGLMPVGTAEFDDELLLSGHAQRLGDGEIVMYKPRWGAFFGTRLDEYLTKNHVDTVVVAGCNYPNCPRASIYEASERDYRIVLVDDAVSGLDDQGRAEMTNIGVTLCETDAVIAAVHAATGSAPYPA
ncbi:cysteine hydrolase family protein [Mycobacterium sp.]|uniref:cysteine hydrolase family protein n=1 Tax=Mycobacterium sp. TaxID=1785 RepID=UPI003C758D74